MQCRRSSSCRVLPCCWAHGSISAKTSLHTGLEIRLTGRNLTPSDHIKLGAYHTLEVELHRPFTIAKEAWDKLDLLRIKQATDPAASADLAVLMITVRVLLRGVHMQHASRQLESAKEDRLDQLRIKQATDPAASADLAVLLITVHSCEPGPG